MATDLSLIDGALRSWRSSMDRAGKLFRSFTDDELHTEIAPGKNRLIYIWGHLAATNDSMIPLLDFGDRLFPELDTIFLTHPDHAVQHEIKASAMAEMWQRLDELLSAEFTKLSPSGWLEPHQAVSPEDFKNEPHRNRFAILLGRTTHLAHHYGQARLAKR
jgi:hypothetical protein